MPTNATIPAAPWVGNAARAGEEVTGDQMGAAMDAVGVDGAVLVSPFSMYAATTPAMRLRFTPNVPASSGWSSRSTRTTLLSPTPSPIGQPPRATIGIRVMMRDNISTDPADPGINRVLAAAAKHGMAVNLLCWGRLEQAGQLAARNPNTQLVIDHLGLQQPFEPPAPPQPWADLPKVLALATHPNIAIKISGACTLSNEPFPYKDIWDPLGRIFDAFGFARCIWGTDWTRAVGLLTYAQGVEAFRVTDRLSDSDRAALMGQTLTQIYNWSPSKA